MASGAGCNDSVESERVQIKVYFTTKSYNMHRQPLKKDILQFLMNHK